LQNTSITALKIDICFCYGPRANKVFRLTTYFDLLMSLIIQLTQQHK